VLWWGCVGVRAEKEAGIVVVKGRDIAPYNMAVSGLKKALQEQKYLLKVVEVDFQGEDRLGPIKEAIDTLQAGVVIALGTSATRAVRGMRHGLPVVYTMILNPAQSGIQPPGVPMDIPPEVKLRETMRILPNIKRVGLIHSIGYQAEVEKIARACETLGLRLVAREIESQKDFSAALSEILKEADCFLMVADPVIYMPRTVEYLLLESLKCRIPVIGLSSAYAKAGAFIAFDCDYTELGRKTAELSLRILNGEKGALEETVVSKKVRFSLNLRAAERMGIGVSSTMIDEAGQLFGR